jgi:hypothetical protein
MQRLTRCAKLYIRGNVVWRWMTPRQVNILFKKTCSSLTAFLCRSLHWENKPARYNTVWRTIDHSIFVSDGIEIHSPLNMNTVSNPSINCTSTYSICYRARWIVHKFNCSDYRYFILKYRSRLWIVQIEILYFLTSWVDHEPWVYLSIALLPVLPKQCPSPVLFQWRSRMISRHLTATRNQLNTEYDIFTIDCIHGLNFVRNTLHRVRADKIVLWSHGICDVHFWFILYLNARIEWILWHIPLNHVLPQFHEDRPVWH